MCLRDARKPKPTTAVRARGRPRAGRGPRLAVSGVISKGKSDELP